MKVDWNEVVAPAVVVLVIAMFIGFCSWAIWEDHQKDSERAALCAKTHCAVGAPNVIKDICLCVGMPQ